VVWKLIVRVPWCTDTKWFRGYGGFVTGAVTPTALSPAILEGAMTTDSLDVYPEATALSPAEGEVATAELVVTDDVLVKAFALGPGATLDAHEHGDSTNVFHVLEGSVTVLQDERETVVEAPGVVLHERGVSHGARNDTDEVVRFTASLCPLPGSG
jgi:quercetin dioxygenase-like cupin family protein